MENESLIPNGSDIEYGLCSSLEFTSFVFLGSFANVALGCERLSESCEWILRLGLSFGISVVSLNDEGTIFGSFILWQYCDILDTVIAYNNNSNVFFSIRLNL